MTKNKTKQNKKPKWWHTLVIPAFQERQEDHKLEASPRKVSKTLSQKQNTNKSSGLGLGSSGRALA
jgi:hypothetical protein